MNNVQEGTEKMSLTSVILLQNNPTIVAQIPGLAALIPTVQTANAAIATIKVQQEAAKSSDTRGKKQLRTLLTTQGIDVARRVLAYCINNNNVTLQALVDYSESDLKKSSDSNLVSICQVIRDNANANITQLAAYGVTAATLTTLQATINNFSTAILKVRIDTTSSNSTTKQLATQFDTLKATWKKIDGLVEIVRLTQPVFYSEYQDVRRIISYGRTKLSLKVQTINAQTGLPEPNVTLVFTQTDGTKKALAVNNKAILIKKTAKSGGGFLRNLPDGNYTVTATKSGFEEAITSVSIINGESTTLTIQLQSEQSYGTA